ncbi:hypothetical protein J1N35_005854 [Gossypium stocksii]|uniref:Uncharacterized protein n=1 Tax=Gossypium stocksii TaxID=47602 RepID=A0A9D3WEM8_9ROSI|nr:hypothetical protein J1N35_005854 [Gossypium stocksii]
MQAFDSLMYTVTLDRKLILAFCICLETLKKRTRKEYKVKVITSLHLAGVELVSEEQLHVSSQCSYSEF